MHTVERERNKARKDSHSHLHAQEEYKKKISSLEKEKNTLMEESRNSQRQLSQSTKQADERNNAMQHQIQLLQNATSRESKRAVLEKYGAGPHRVKFILRIPSTDDKVELQSFQVEMASLELVPHAVHLFLEQVDHKLWDNCFVYLNGPHVLQSGPRNYQAVDQKQKLNLKKFENQSLDKLAFPEYSAEFPHEQYVSSVILLLLVSAYSL